MQVLEAETPLRTSLTRTQMEARASHAEVVHTASSTPHAAQGSLWGTYQPSGVSRNDHRAKGVLESLGRRGVEQKRPANLCRSLSQHSICFLRELGLHPEAESPAEIIEAADGMTP